MATVTPGEGFITGGIQPSQTFKVEPSSDDETANTVDVDLENIIIYDSGNNVATSDVDVTFDGTTVTIADGSSYNLQATDTIIITVHGTPVA
jgi:archaellum component FlaF (FlaF/FlaG flagellin family)